MSGAEQILLFDENADKKTAKAAETARKATEAKEAFERMREVVKNAPEYRKPLANSETSSEPSPERNRFARKLREPDTRRDWTKDHEDRQDERPERYGPAADRSDLSER